MTSEWRRAGRTIGLSLGLTAMACTSETKEAAPQPVTEEVPPSRDEAAPIAQEVAPPTMPEAAAPPAENRPQPPDPVEPGATPVAEMAARLIELSEKQDLRGLAALASTDKGLVHVYKADGSVGPDTTLDTSDGNAFAAQFAGDDFHPLHYVNEAMAEMSDPERAKTLRIDEEALEVRYEGISGHWGVVFEFVRGRASGLHLHKIETWDVEP